MKTNKTLEKQKRDAAEWLTKQGAANFIPQAFAKIENDFRKKQKRNFVIFWIIIFSLATALINYVRSQERQFSIMAGLKAVEVSYYFTAENELIYGIALSAIDAKLSEDIVNFHDNSELLKP